MEPDVDDEYYPAIEAQAQAIVTPPPVTEPEPELDVLDLDAVMAHTQKIRLKVQKQANLALAQGVDTEMLNILLKSATDMDKAVVNRRRVGIEEEQAKTAEQSQRDGAALLRAISDKMFKVDPLQVDTTRVLPSLPDSLGDIVPVPGQTDIGVHEMTYDAFAKTQAPQEP